MASSKAYLEFILEQLSGVGNITHRAMMGEYLLYCDGKLFGGIYDDRFLVKVTRSSQAMLPDAPLELLYEGAKAMLLVDRIDDREFLASLLDAMTAELPAPKRKKQ